MLRTLVLTLVFLVSLHPNQGHVLQEKNATQRWSEVAHKYQRLYRASYYNVHYEPLTWFEASKVCSSEGAHLLIINSQAEAQAVQKFVDPSVETYSIGFHDLFEEENFNTVQCTYCKLSLRRLHQWKKVTLHYWGEKKPLKLLF
jgi:hypothetical protein